MKIIRGCILAAFSSIIAASSAQNPIINTDFTADPTARVFNGKVYLYPSHDIHSPIERLKEWFCMADYHVYSSSDLVDWTDHGVIVTQNKVPWVEPDSYAMWAPDCVCKDGMYYFYFPAAPKGVERGFGIGVAIAQQPEGPFRPMPFAIEGVHGIDPCVLIDDDGSSYIYWQGMGLKGARLKDNMMQLASEPVALEGIAKGFVEGPFAFKRDGKYYITYPWVRTEGGTETLAYSMSDSPLGPFEFKGLIMEESPTGCWTNHHSLIEYNGQWYLFYHHNDYSPDMDKRRSARIDKLYFNPDGTIQLVQPTLRGVGIISARQPINIDRYNDINQKKVKIEFLNNDNKFEGWKTVFVKKGGWVRFNDVDFGAKTPSIIKARARARKSSNIRVNIDTPTGAVAGEFTIPASDDWTMVEAPLTGIDVTGVHDLYVSMTDGAAAEVDYIGYDQIPWSRGAMQTGQYRNVFAEMGYPQDEIDKKLQQIFHDLFYGENKVYFEVGDSMAYISDLKNHDVRTEGMSYGMMIAVQLDKKDIFDRLWRWSKKYMQHQDGQREGYFAWSCDTDGKPNALGAASDGELYFITSLIFASNRWGNDTGINYLAEAQHILNQSMQKSGMSDAAPLVNIEHKLITFTPDPFGGRYTDPSYHIPAFYEVWAEWADDGRAAFWRDCAKRSREYLHKATHPVTGLNPDYSNYDGSQLGNSKRGMIIGDEFRFDSWRVPMNVALDYSWSCADREWQQAYADRIQAFFYSKGVNDFVDQYNIDGTDVERILQAGEHTALRHSIGLVATTAAATLAATDPRSREFVEAFWTAEHKPYSDGYFDAYYDGLLRLFAFMHLSGNYRIITK